MVEQLKKPNTSNSTESWSIIRRMTKKIGNAIHWPSDEEIFKIHGEAWDKFPEEVKKQMLESLDMKDKIDILWLDFIKIWEPDVSKEWDTIKFKEWIEKEDSIWTYIEINWIKCRRYQYGVSWFVYENIRTRHRPHQRLKVWFCEKWIRQSSAIIDYSFKARQA